jgi:hypothetical protein
MSLMGPFGIDAQVLGPLCGAESRSFFPSAAATRTTSSAAGEDGQEKCGGSHKVEHAGRLAEPVIAGTLLGRQLASRLRLSLSLPTDAGLLGRALPLVGTA